MCSNWVFLQWGKIRETNNSFGPTAEYTIWHPGLAVVQDNPNSSTRAGHSALKRLFPRIQSYRILNQVTGMAMQVIHTLQQMLSSNHYFVITKFVLTIAAVVCVSQTTVGLRANDAGKRCNGCIAYLLQT